LAEQQLPEIDDAYVEKYNMMQEVCRHDAGISLLQYLHRICGAGNPCMDMEQAARRDIWLTLQQFIPVEKLPLIEYQQLRQRHQQVREMLEAMQVMANSQGEDTDE